MSGDYRSSESPSTLVWVPASLTGASWRKKDGIETMRELRALAPGIPIIAMSGGWSYRPELSLLKAAEHLGAFLSIEKPYTAAAMLATVGKALGGETQGPLE